LDWRADAEIEDFRSQIADFNFLAGLNAQSEIKNLQSEIRFSRRVLRLPGQITAREHALYGTVFHK
jgi:hypothetical protein